MDSARILVVDDDDNLRWVLQTQLEQMGYAVIAAADGPTALGLIDKEPPALVLTDLKMPGMSGMELLEQIRRDYPEIPVLIVTAFGTIQTAVQAMRPGANDYLTKPLDYDELEIAVSRVLEHFRLVQEVRSLRASLDSKYGFENIIGHSEALLSVLDTAVRAAQGNSTILIHAETGTGKELLAKAIHFNSGRKDKAFVTINCTTIPRDLLESELFGPRKAIVHGRHGAQGWESRIGRSWGLVPRRNWRDAGRSSGEAAALLQQGELEKLGATAPAKVDVRFVAATHRNLRAMIEDGGVPRRSELPLRGNSIRTAGRRGIARRTSPSWCSTFSLRSRMNRAASIWCCRPPCCPGFRTIDGPVISASLRTSLKGL